MSKPASHLSAQDLERLRAALEHKRQALLAAQRAGDPARRAIGDAESEDGDAAERIIEQDEALRLGAFDAAVLADVDHALAKLDAGRYGVSEDSGDPIPLARLEAIPWARRTAEEETETERGA